MCSLLSRNDEEVYQVNVSKELQLFPCIHPLGVNQSDGDFTTWKGFGIMNPQNTSVCPESVFHGEHLNGLYDSLENMGGYVKLQLSKCYNAVKVNDLFYKKVYADKSFHCRNTNLFLLLLQFHKEETKNETGQQLLLALKNDSAANKFDKDEIERVYNEIIVQNKHKESHKAMLRPQLNGPPSQKEMVFYLLSHIPRQTKTSWFGGKTKRRKLKKRAKSRAKR